MIKIKKSLERGKYILGKSFLPIILLTFGTFLYSIKLPGDVIVDRVDKLKEGVLIIHTKQLNNKNALERFVLDLFSKISGNSLRGKDICSKYLHNNFSSKTYVYQQVNVKSYDHILIVGKDTMKTTWFTPNYTSKSISFLFPLSRNIETLVMKDELEQILNLLPDKSYFDKRDSILSSIGYKDIIKSKEYQRKRAVLFSQLHQLRETIEKAMSDDNSIEIDSTKYFLPNRLNTLYFNYPQAQGTYNSLRKIPLESLCN